MAPSKRFWCCIIICIVLHLALVDCKKIDDFKSTVLKRCKRDTNLNKNGRKIADFTSSVALTGIGIALSISNPLFKVVSLFVVGTLLDLIWPTSGSYQSIRADVIADIRNEMNKQATAEMKMKLRDYGEQIKNAFSVLQVQGYKIEQWNDSVLKNGISLQKQSSLLQEYKSRVNSTTWEFFKIKIVSLATDIGNDGHQFHIQNDPTSSLEYYREFVTTQIGLWVAELMIYAGNDAEIHLKNLLQNKIKTALKNHYKYVMWAIHKSATIIESKHKSRLKYKEVVNSWNEQFPLDAWKQLSGYSGHSRFIRSSDTVSFKYLDLGTGYSKTRFWSSWMSCWGSGTKCAIRNCPEIDNPFVAGEQYQYKYHCRGEVFWIYGEIYDYIQACDKVAIHYSSWGDKHYWFSLDSYRRHRTRRWFFNTRQCPGKSFMYEPFNGRCLNEILTIEVEGKTCGELVEDRDVIMLKGRYDKYVTSAVWYELIPGMTKWWRIFKHDSFLKSFDNSFM
ncbi:uncharacterized protein LOC127725336 [Mytilus californianus]|uniref:uncharacterized protein LOC127725336 n=1 Tax=Mytilus californianus TaxID=6549 RepID=UPI002247CEF1|nr:uncharacterized protein LOC127725336 [Mytilus californianus]XP_052088227.1 uncharacterized protein LOC127725336 [Mytilus californianus]